MALQKALNQTTVPLRSLREYLKLPSEATPEDIIRSAARKLNVDSDVAERAIETTYKKRGRLPGFASKLHKQVLEAEQKQNLNGHDH